MKPKEMPPELAGLVSADGTSLDPQYIDDVMHRYGAMLTSGDLDGIVQMYAPDAVVRDPYTAPPDVGRDAIRAFYAASIDTLGAVTMEVEGDVRVVGNHGAAAYISEFTVAGKRLRLRTLDVMHFNSDGLVTAMDAFWGIHNISLI